MVGDDETFTPGSATSVEAEGTLVGARDRPATVIDHLPAISELGRL